MGKAAVFLVGLAVILALLFGVASRALAADGDPFLLGEQNVASAVSQLVKQGPGPALSLEVEAKQPPLEVNSKKKVARLNADSLDGKNSTDFYAAGSKVADSNHADQADNAANADKVDGKHANDLAVKTAFTSGFGANPTTTTQFLAQPAIVSVGTGEAVHVTSNKAFGSTATGGANALNLYTCYRPQGSTATPNLFGGGILGNQVAQNTRVTMGLSGVLVGLSSGNYEVGLCGSSSSPNWNSNEWSYTSAMVVEQATSSATASSSSAPSVNEVSER